MFSACANPDCKERFDHREGASFDFARSIQLVTSPQHALCAAPLVVRKMFRQVHARVWGGRGCCDDLAPYGPAGRTGYLPIHRCGL